MFHQFGLTQGNTAEVVKVEGQGRCMLDAGGYIFTWDDNTYTGGAGYYDFGYYDYGGW